jgi:hypothetical protein
VVTKQFEAYFGRKFVFALRSHCQSGSLAVAVQLFMLHRQLFVMWAEPLDTDTALKMAKSVGESLRQDKPGTQPVLLALLGELFATGTTLAITTLEEILNSNMPLRTAPERLQLTVRQEHPLLAPEAYLVFARHLVTKGRRTEAYTMIVTATNHLGRDERAARAMFNAFFDEIGIS